MRAELERLARDFPDDIACRIVFDTRRFVTAAIEEIILTLAITLALVVLVVFVFLQDWRATLIPALTIPVSLIGVFAVLLAMGYSANTISLLAVILAITLVVDDSIVVVENVQRVTEEGAVRRRVRPVSEAHGAEPASAELAHAGHRTGME